MCNMRYIFRVPRRCEQSTETRSELFFNLQTINILKNLYCRYIFVLFLFCSYGKSNVFCCDFNPAAYQTPEMKTRSYFT